MWPVFGATNQLLASLALLVVSVWLVRERRPAWVSAAPMVAMLVITGYAIALLTKRFADEGATMLFVIALLMGVMQVWIVIECVVVALRARRAALALS